MCVCVFNAEIRGYNSINIYNTCLMKCVFVCVCVCVCVFVCAYISEQLASEQ